MREGANDYVMKDRLGRLIPTVEREVREATNRKLQRESVKTLAKRDEELRQSKKLEAIGRLAGGVAHEFNNMLSVILGSATFIAEDHMEDHTTLKNAEEILKAGRRAADITQQLLAFGRKQDVTVEVVDANEVVHSAFAMSQHLVETHIKIKTTLQPDVGCLKLGRHQLEQVLMNLIINARDAMPEGGRLVLRTSRTEVEGDHTPGLKQGWYVCIEVADNGCGMDQETIDNAFEPFYTTKGVGEGTGLGLAMVYGIVKQNHGHISVDSTVGSGTTVAILVPLRDRCSFGRFHG